MQMQSVVWLSIGLLVTCHWGASKAVADPLTFYFEGYITFLDDDLDLDESVHVGAPFSGSYTFDPTGVSDYYADSANVGLYQFPTGQLRAQIGNYEFLSMDLQVLIWNNFGLSGDVYEPISTTPFLAAGYQWSGISVLLNDRTGTALNSDALPTYVPDLSQFQTYRVLLLERYPGDELGIRGTLTSLTPEPGSLVLLSLGAVLLCRRRHRERV